jgi:hypothetical protein
MSAFGYAYKNITTAATTTVKASPGTLGGISVNTSQSGASAVVYDNTAASGTKIGTFALTAAGMLADVPAGVAFTTGLTIVTSGSTAADITVFYL